MAEMQAGVLIIHGEDEYGITQCLADLQAGLGDPSMASMNFTRLDGQSATFDQLVNAASPAPFLLPLRLVILTNPLHKLAAKENEARFLAFLEKLSPTTILALVHSGDLGTWKKKEYYPHNLEKWAQQHKDKARVKWYQNRPEDMATKLYAMAKNVGAEINTLAAQELARLVGQDTMLAAQEIQKLGAYVNYERPITVDDVKLLVEDSSPPNIFNMVDAIGAGNGKVATSLLRKLMEESEPFEIMGMVVRQFRYLLLAREVLDVRGSQEDAVIALNLQKNQAWLARKYMDQARRFTYKDLFDIYHRLLDTDEAMKTGGIEPGLGLEMLVAALSGQKDMVNSF